VKDNVVILPVNTTLDIPTERVLNAALEANLDQCILIGRDQEGKLYFAASYGKCKDVLWDLEQLKYCLLTE
jgi:hypothetical protein